MGLEVWNILSSAFHFRAMTHYEDLNYSSFVPSNHRMHIVELIQGNDGTGSSSLSTYPEKD